MAATPFVREQLMIWLDGDTHDMGYYRIHTYYSGKLT